jgi:hypothetical protein
MATRSRNRVGMIFLKAAIHIDRCFRTTASTVTYYCSYKRPSYKILLCQLVFAKLAVENSWKIKFDYFSRLNGLIQLYNSCYTAKMQLYSWQ